MAKDLETSKRQNKKPQGSKQGALKFPDRQQMRNELPASKKSAAKLIRELRDNERY